MKSQRMSLMTVRCYAAALAWGLLSFTMTSQNMWTWMQGTSGTNQPPNWGTQGTPAPGNSPGSRLGAVSWTDATGKLWLFGGLGNNTIYADLWQYDPSSGQWTFMKGVSTTTPFPGVYGTQGVPSATAMPGSRTGATAWTDANGDLWLFGGYGYNGSMMIDYQNDLWRYNISANQWTWIRGSSTLGSQAGTYGTMGTPSPANNPGSRRAAVGIKDNSGNLWLFGGEGMGQSASGGLNDLWKYNVANNEWTWVSGSSSPNVAGVYGTIGVPASSVSPGARGAAVGWFESNHVWVFGGVISTGNPAMNDLWKFDIATGNWTWMSGSSSTNQPGVYGPAMVPTSTATPGARMGAVAIKDATNNLLLFGGNGIASSAAAQLNDLWKYSISSGQWTFMKGLPVGNQNGLYGSMGVSNPANVPGGRFGMTVWDRNGELWIHGGTGLPASGTVGVLGDLWKFDYCPAPSEPVITTPSASLSVCAGTSNTIAAYAGSATINWYITPTATAAVSTGTAFSVPISSTSGTAIVYTYYLDASGNCGMSSRIPVQVTVNPQPTVTASGIPTLICAGQQVTLNLSGADEYLWQSSETTSTLAVIPTTNTTYSATGTRNGCTGLVTISLSVSACAGLGESDAGGIAVYPNPASSHLNVNGAAGEWLRVTDISGRECLRVKIGSGSAVDISALQAGVYILSVGDRLRMKLAVE